MNSKAINDAEINDNALQDDQLHIRTKTEWFDLNDTPTFRAKERELPKSIKSEARKVCGKISRLLSDKTSRTRGSCMFRKRKRRSEKFAIIGYGTQPVEENTETDSELEESESLSSLSTDDEIEVYDKPGPNNILEQDSNLNSYQKVVQRQLRGLAMDAIQMKGKGAKLFARRQRRMERYVVDGSVDAETAENRSKDFSCLSISPDPIYVLNRRAESEEDVATSGEKQENFDIHTPVTFNNIHAGGSQEVASHPSSHYNSMDASSTHPYHDSITSEDDSSCNQRKARSKRFRPIERMPWMPSNNYASADWSTDDESAHSSFAPTNNMSDHEKDVYEVTKEYIEPRRRFRSVKPPKPQNLASNKNESPQNLILKENNLTNSTGHPSLHPNYNVEASNNSTGPIRKTWSSVKFEPNTTPQKLDMNQQSSVAYPFQLSQSTVAHPFQLSQATVTTNPSLCSSVNIENSFQSLSTNPASKMKMSSHSINLTKARSRTSHCDENQQNKGEDENNAIQADNKHTFFPVNDSSGNQQGIKSLSQKDERDEEVMPPSQLSSHLTPEVEKKLDDSSDKPRVAACLKLLDPSKGKYEPKMELVYKQTPSIASKLDNRETLPIRIHNQPQQFNRPQSINRNYSQITYMHNQESVCRQDSKKPQALGVIAGELKGKGAKMFEKQQKRMDRYTRECNGNKEELKSGMLAYHNPHAAKVSGDVTKANMTQVLGEFKMVSDSEMPRRPSLKKNKRDPLHYHQHYIIRRSPSPVDFVTVDDAPVLTSDSHSRTSSITSQDRRSTSSLGRAVDVCYQDDVFHNNINPRGPAPKVPPKPKMKKIVDSVGNLPINRTASSRADDDEAKIDYYSLKDETIGECPFHNRSYIETTREDDKEVISILSDEDTGNDEEKFNGSSTSANKEKQRFDVWSPKQPLYNPPSFDHLPPPPSYQEATVHAPIVPKPKFKVTNATYQTYSPGARKEDNFDLKTEENDSFHVSTTACTPPHFTSPRPKFNAKAAVVKWQPGSN